MRNTPVFALALVVLGGCTDDSKPSRDVGGADAGSGVVNVDAPTWHEHVAPLVVEKCSGCHEAGGIAPFSLQSYESARPFAAAMADAVESGRMPPFLAQETDQCQPKHRWVDDLRLSAEEKKMIRDWAAAEAPKGEPSAAAALRLPVKVKLEREDVIMTLPSELVIEGKKDIHTCVIVDPRLTKQEYVTGRLITAGNPKVLHHVVSYVIQPGDIEDPVGSGIRRKRTKPELEAMLLAEKGAGIGGQYDCFGGPALTTVSTELLDAWAPGGTPNLAPADAGQPVHQNSLVLLDIHYHPTGSEERDGTTKLSLMLSQTRPKYVARALLLGNFQGTVTFGAPTAAGGDAALLQQPGESKPEFMIPANAEGHIEEMTWKWRLPQGPIRVTGMGTHMHYVGRKMRISLEHDVPKAEEDKEECLIETPAWDFNWQRGYGYDTSYENLPEMRNGDTLKFHCEFDNTMNNRFVVEALEDQELSEPVDIRLGEDTLDEMCLGAVGIMYQNTAP